MPTRRRSAKASKQSESTRQVPVNWNFPENLLTGYATNVLVQGGEHELWVSFFEAAPPVLFGPEDIKKLESLNADCFARIAIAPGRMQAMIDALQQQLNNFNAKAEKKRNGTK